MTAATVAARSRWRPAAHVAQAGTWSRDRVVAAINDWVAVVGQRPRIYEWAPASARAAGLYNANCARWERDHPRWPSTQTVIQYFGSWTQGLQAAGFDAPNRRPPLTLAERVADARRLSAKGLRQAQIAELLGVAPSTVSLYLAAGACSCGEPVIRSRASPPRCRRCAVRARLQPPWDEATILAAYRTWQAAHGRRPFRLDWSPDDPHALTWHAEYPRWPSAGEVVVVFGRWSALVRAAGDEPARRAWTREAVLAALGELALELGHAPRSTELAAAAGMPSRSTVRAHFGSWPAALTALGMTPERSPRYADDQLLDALRAAERRLDRPPTQADMRGQHPGPATIRARFGTWTAALTTAGIDEPKPPDRRAVIAALRAAASARGHAPTSDEWRRADRPNRADVVRLFGSWSAGLRAAGLKPHTAGWSGAGQRTEGMRRTGTWTSELVIARLREWTDQVGRPPTRAEWQATPSRSSQGLSAAAQKRQRARGYWPSLRVVQRECGSWQAAFGAAGIVDTADSVPQSTGDRIRLAQILRRDGHNADDIAVHLGISKWTVFRYQHAADCRCCNQPAFLDTDRLCATCRVPVRSSAWDRQSTIDAIRAWYREVGRPPATSEWRHGDPRSRWVREHPRFPSYEQVRRLFDSWQLALQAAGIHAVNSRWTDQEIVAALQRWHATHGRAPTQRDWRDRDPLHQHPNASVVTNRFGSWADGLRAAGLTPATRRWTDAELLDALRAWAQAHGRAPTSTEWPNASADHPARGTILNHFGSWIIALDTAGLQPGTAKPTMPGSQPRH